MGKRARRTRKQRRRRQRREQRNRIVHDIVARGDHEIDHRGCPVCAQLAGRGEPVWIHDANGSREVDASELPEQVMIDVAIRGDTTLWPILPFDPIPVTIPVGCDLETLVQYLFFCDPALRSAAEVDGVIARINGEDSHVAQLLRHGDEVTLTLGTPVPAVMPSC